MDRRARFDRTINVANVLSAIAILLALWGMSVRLESRLTTIETRLAPLWDDYNFRIRAASAPR